MEEDLKKEYLFEGNSTGCLVIHGFTSTPAELRELSENIRNNLGYTVLGVRLKGHGTDVLDMEKCTYMDWINSAVEAYERLKKKCEKIYVIGHSMGGAIALYIAENYEVDKVVALAPALINKSKASNLAFIIYHFLRYTSWPEEKRPEEEAKYLLGYNKVPLKSVAELNKLASAARKNLNKVNKPTLVIYSHGDNSVDERSIDLIKEKAGTRDVKIVYLEKCRHNITIECEKHKVFKEVLNFIE